MFKRKVVKITFVLACIMSLIMPYVSPVLAAALTHEDTTAELQVLVVHEGGEESSKTLTDEQKEYYDISPYGYSVGETRVYKIIQKDDTAYENMFYCLDATKSFPGVTNEGYNSLEYTNVADLKDSMDLNVKALRLSTEYDTDSEKWNSNYKSLIWLLDNMYLEKQTPEQKDDFLAKAFADYETYDLETVKAFLTDDDIDVVQQYAIWYFTNNDATNQDGVEIYNPENLPAINLLKLNMDATTEEGSYNDLTGYPYRQEMAAHLYKYLVESAKVAEEATTVTYPAMAETTTGAELLDDANYYVAGPFKVTAGTAASTEYSIKLLDQDSNEISRADYKIYIEGEEDFTDKNVNEIFDVQYYIYLPKENKTITKVNLELSYSNYETEASLWKNNTTNEDGVEVYQPVALVTRAETPHKVTVGYDIDRSTADLALRKYIVKVNDETVNRAPVVDVTGLKNGTSTTAVYKHAKAPVKVSNGDTIVYEIRVYNEADIDARGTIIVDALPKGLELVENSNINTTYGWTKVSEGENVVIYTSEYLRNEVINAFDKENDETLNSAYVQIECKVTDSAKASSVLTNIAEVKEDEVEDRDSTPDNNDYTKNDYDSTGYTGNNENKEDLTDPDYFYKGREDDDDFEKVEVVGKTFDLSLQKFVSKINKNAPTTSREPVVDVTKLKNGTSTNATYTTVKTPLVVEKGDIITYTIRVYNEGELDGYAEEVSDYLPEGLGFLVGHTTNVDNYWSIPENTTTVKLTSIENAIKNVSIDDFADIDKYEDVDVVIGKVKLTSTKLKSADTDTKNLIEGFDKENGTELKYKDIQVVCVVLTDEVSNYNLRNVAEVTKDSDNNREDVTDIDSNPDTVNPDEYPGEESKEDDNDYENLTTESKEFDLSLQKFITKVNNDKVTGREPKVTVTDGKIQYSVENGATDPLYVENGDLITYTIRVYNEGNISGYAKEISDNLPKGLEFVKDNETNKKYGWKLYDKDGNVTTDLDAAVSVKTEYLSKEEAEDRKDDCLLDAFDKATSKSPDYEDIQIVFKVVENKATDKAQRTIKNVAEITDDEDENGDPIDDVDSTPDNNKDGEDDIDDESVYVKYFDLSLQKDLVKIIITENGTTREIPVSSTDGLQKVEIHRKRIDTTTVKFVYNITVKNEGEIAGYATEITDYIPEGLEFIAEENTQWTKVSDKKITTNALEKTKLQPGETASVQVVLKWVNDENNFDKKVNKAEISEDKNDSNTPDIDSTPDNQKDGEDDIDTAEVILSISTGTAPTYIWLALTVLAIMATGIALIKKYVLI
ncbi:MAG: Cys-Gln thioester bond-forming surface protein [Clostridia bacterium]|nr:Cys-Gln thioester bond-forming surface protein [Clostridia bacterium]